SIDKYRQIDFRNEMLDLFYKVPFRQQHFVGLGTNTPNLSSRFTAGWDRERGDREGNQNERLTLRSTNILKLGSKISVQGQLSYSHNKGMAYGNIMDYNYTVGGGKIKLYPYAQFLGENGESLPIPNSYNMDYIRSLKGSGLLDWMYYPIDEIGKTVTHTRQNHLQMQVSLDYKPTEGLKLSAFYNTEIQPNDNERLYKEDSFYVRNLVNRFTQVNGDNFQYIFPRGAVKTSTTEMLRSYNVRGQADYTRLLNGRHDISMLLGGEISHRQVDSKGFWVQGYDEDLMVHQSVDPINTYPIYDGLSSNSRIPDAGRASYSNQVRRFVSMFFNSGYTYDNRYGLSLSVRRDASNLFGVKTNDKWNPLWSVGASWTLSEEPFLREHEWITNMRLRGTYGHSGNSGGVANTLPLIHYTN